MLRVIHGKNELFTQSRLRSETLGVIRVHSRDFPRITTLAPSSGENFFLGKSVLGHLINYFGSEIGFYGPE